MRALVLTLLLTLPIPAAMAQEAGGYTCESIIANAERGGMDTQMAIATYFHGVFMGKSCVKVDYDRAHALAQGAGISFEPWARILRDSAATGHPTAVAAVKRLGL